MPVAGKGTLRRNAAAHRVTGRPEDDEETVAFCPQLPAAASIKRLTQQGALSRKHLGVPLAKAGQQGGRPLHVAEKQRHCP